MESGENPDYAKATVVRKSCGVQSSLLRGSRFGKWELSSTVTRCAIILPLWASAHCVTHETGRVTLSEDTLDFSLSHPVLQILLLESHKPLPRLVPKTPLQVRHNSLG